VFQYVWSKINKTFKQLFFLLFCRDYLPLLPPGWRVSRWFQKVNNTLTEIDLTRNNIGAAGAEALAEALKATAPVLAGRGERWRVSLAQFLVDSEKSLNFARNRENTL
jgi:hypothetical protein